MLKEDLKKMSKKKLVGLILLAILAIFLWQVSIPVIMVWLVFKKTKISKVYKWLLSIGLVICYMGILGTFTYNNDKGSQSVEVPIVHKEITQTEVIQKKNIVTFDINSIYNKNVSEIIKILGKPSIDTEPTKLQIEMGTTEWDKTFKKDGYELLVTYNTANKKVIDFFVSAKSDSETTSTGMEKILLALNADKNSSKYKVEFVKMIKDSSRFTGVKITPNN